MWDGLNTHLSRAIRELVAARSWLRAFRFPPYASELKPVETGLVKHQKVTGQPHQARHRPLIALIKTRLRRMQYRPGLLDGFLAKTGLNPSNFHTIEDRIGRLSCLSGLRQTSDNIHTSEPLAASCLTGLFSLRIISTGVGVMGAWGGVLDVG